MPANPESILSIRDRMPRRMKIPQWGVPVYVRALSVADLPHVEQMDRVDLAVAGLCDANGEPFVWSAAQRRALYDKHAAALDAIALEVLKLTGVREDDAPPPAPPKQTSMGDVEWQQVQNSLRSLASGPDRRTKNTDNSQHAAV